MRFTSWPVALCVLASTCFDTTARNIPPVQYAVQEPLPAYPEPKLSTSFSSESWDLNEVLTENTTAQWIFSSASGLLQSNPNIRYRNGHSIVPGIVRAGTLLYHGRNDSNSPTTPEWFAFNTEVSYMFCQVLSINSPGAGAWHHTFRVTRPLRILYFDGAGNFLLGDGPLDSQDIVAWGEVMPNLAFAEAERIEKLCEWGRRMGLDGFIRMAVVSELMLCNYRSVEAVSSVHLEITPLPPYWKTIGKEPELPRFPTDTIPIDTNFIGMIKTGLRTAQYPGLSPVRLDLTRFVSFYDLDLVPSLAKVRSGKRRWQHRLLGIDKEDIKRVRGYLEEQLVNEKAWLRAEAWEDTIDWMALLHSIVEPYGEYLEDIWNLVSTTTNKDQALVKQVQDTFQLIESLARPFVLFSVAPPESFFNETSGSLDWASPVFQECSTSIIPALHRVSSLSHSEKLLLDAVKHTTRELCRGVIKVWVRGVQHGLSKVIGVHRESLSEHSDVSAGQLLDIWRTDLEILREWLDWGVWLRCRPVCGENEMCYIPTYPFSVGESKPEWHADDPKTRCVRKVAPYVYADDYNP
ncbi:hypothetical protein BDP27DRAFT_288822 [Rhodocollybia butyracea]|uniref:Uncharacterized protein n=1 Tax=Rhodocollybia butyracea TaxID=206335 RepID=A0A9P5Q255_9AGAR|nr:hypothetical protein BDP27DRAFT_288822 [Rhodocollybia butyracea]